jgi:tRNA(Ile)-lysidine synthase
MPAQRVTSWPRVAERLAASLPRDQLDPAVCLEADDSGRRRWIVAVSGGADSVALLLLVWAHWPQHRDRVVVAHFNHRLRGAASAGDARFCAALARGLGCLFESESWTDRPTGVSEAAARTARNEFLGRVRRRHRSTLVWTGHQQDDVAESMLMRLARGSGTAGLAAPRPVQAWGREGQRLRPLLGLTRATLRDALADAGGRWREDESNEQGDFFRNRVRATVIPAWTEAAERDALAGAALSRRRLEEDDTALEAWLDELSVLNADGSLNLKALRGRPMALWRRAVHRWLAGHAAQRGDLARRGFEQLLTLAMAGRTSRFILGAGGYARIRKGRMYFEKLSS